MKTDLTFIHLTDLHILADDTARLMTQPTMQKLRALLAHIRAMEITPDFFVISGDLGHAGDEAEYQRLQIALAELKRFGVPLILGLGNHDRRLPFRKVVLGEDETDETKPYYHSTLINGLRIIMLDSTVPDQVHGTLDAAQLAWLAAELRKPAPLGNLIALHHPPVFSTVEQLNAHVLSNPDELAQVIAGHPVHAILSGHIHYHHTTLFHGILSITTEASAYSVDPGVQQDLSAVDGSGFTLCSLRDGQFYANPITLREQTELLHRAAEEA